MLDSSDQAVDLTAIYQKLEQMAKAGKAVDADGDQVDIKTAQVTIATGTTDGEVVAAVSGKKIMVLGAYVQVGATAQAVQFNSKPAGAGTAITPNFEFGANGGVILPLATDSGWFETNSGEGLSATTSGAGSNTAILVRYIEV